MCFNLVLFSTDFDEIKESTENGKGGIGVRFDPVIQTIEGWKVHIDPALLVGDQSNLIPFYGAVASQHFTPDILL